MRIRILYVPADGTPEVKEIANDLKVLQDLVGGYIETDRLTPTLISIVNEKGLIHDLPVNKHFKGTRWYRGNVLIVRAPYWAEDFDSITLEDIVTLMAEFDIGSRGKLQSDCNLLVEELHG